MTKENAGEIIRGGVGKFAKTDKGCKRVPISDKHKIEHKSKFIQEVFEICGE